MRWLAILMMMLPMPAAAFVAQNGMRAQQVSPTDIAVGFQHGRDDVDYWCAAGDLVQRQMGMAGTTRLWRASPKPRGAGQGIIFTIDPDRQAEGAGLSQFGAGPRDGSISAGAAVASHCRRIPPFLVD